MIRKWTMFEFKTEMKLLVKKGLRVKSLYLMKDDKTLIVGCTDHILRVFDLASEECINEIPLHNENKNINDICMNTEETMIYTAS